MPVPALQSIPRRLAEAGRVVPLSFAEVSLGGGLVPGSHRGEQSFRRVNYLQVVQISLCHALSQWLLSSSVHYMPFFLATLLTREAICSWKMCVRLTRFGSSERPAPVPVFVFCKEMVKEILNASR